MSKKITYEEFIEKLRNVRPDITLVGDYIDGKTETQFQCKAGHIFNNKPFIVLHSHGGCPYCKGRKILIGYNDIWTTRPDLGSMLTYPEDGYKYTYGSSKKVWFNCPDCGISSLKAIYNVSNYGFGCQHCSDGVSYPNKFSRALLNQLPIDSYDCEYQPEWASPYYYDNHFWYNGSEYILEMDGALHFKEQQLSGITINKINEVDKLKDELAMQHNIHIIRIDCKNSDMEYIKSNILHSELNDIFDLSNIDWILCDQKGQKNILKEACLLYMSKTHSLSEIGNIIHVHPATVSRYLKQGAKFGWCDYVPQRDKGIVVFDDDNHIIHTFVSISECCRKMRDLYKSPFCAKLIRSSCNTQKPYKNFNFRFKKDT